MSRRWNTGTGLEGAPDIMLLTMAALMVSIVWLASHAHDATLPAIDPPTSAASRLGGDDASRVRVTLRPGAGGETEVWVEERRISGGAAALRRALAASGAGAVTLRADVDTRWEDGLLAMNVAAELGLPVSVAAERAAPPAGATAP